MYARHLGDDTTRQYVGQVKYFLSVSFPVLNHIELLAYVDWFALETKEHNIQVTKKRVIRGDNVVSKQQLAEKIYLVNLPGNENKYYCLGRNRNHF